MKRTYIQRDNPKAKARQLQAEWEALLRRHSFPLFNRSVRTVINLNKINVKKESKTNAKVTSFDSMVGSTAKPETKIYTGTEIIGLAQMHKSNIVPIFKKEEAIEVAQMRRN